MARRQTLRGGTLDEAIDALLAQMISLGVEMNWPNDFGHFNRAL